MLECLNAEIQRNSSKQKPLFEKNNKPKLNQ